MLQKIVVHLNIGQLINQKTYSQRFFDRTGHLLRVTLSGDEKYRLSVNVYQLDKNYIQALLKKEDRFFYYHPGFNPLSLLRATNETFIKKGNRQGASTLTMQVVRLLYPDSTKNSSGKMLQILQAIKLEFLYSKNEILLAYLSWTPYGSNLEGIETACFFYFKKKCQKLTESQIQFLVSIPQSPQKYINQAQLSKADLVFKNPHFVDYLIQMNLNQKDIITSIDSEFDSDIKKITDQYFLSQKSFGIKNYTSIVLDSLTNQIVSYNGSADYQNNEIKGQIDANRTLKSPGSTLKPFIYALALQQGLIHEKSLLKDTKMSFAGFNPENFDQQFLGPLSAELALVLSRNLPAAELSTKLHDPTLYEFLDGKSSLKFKSEMHYGLSLALGGVEFSMLDLIKLYSALANQGKYRELNFFKNLNLKETAQQILTPEAVYIVLQMLKTNSRSENEMMSKLAQTSAPVAWKTGTSKSYKDAWTIGLFGRYVIGVWFGDNDKVMNPSLVGRNLAAPLFFQIHDYIKNNSKYNHEVQHPRWDSKVGLNIKSVSICSVSKKLPTKNCTHHLETSLFIPTVSTIESCQIHRKIYFDPVSKKMNCLQKSANQQNKIIEVWPDELFHAFKQSGLKKIALSDQNFSCDHLDNSSTQLFIASPQSSIEYILTSKKNIKTKKKEFKTKIQLNAMSESDSQYLDWFVNKVYIGRSFKKEPLFYEAHEAGNYQVTVTDNLGRTNSSTFKVKLSF